LLGIKFLTPFQSEFRPGNSTTNQLLLITHKIYEDKEVKMVFLDISKAFDKVWHRGLLLKLERLGVRDPLLKWFRSYLTGRKQRVIIDGQSSNWRQIEAGVPQGSVLGPLLFYIYIDITTNLQSNYFLYADDTSLLEIVDDPALTSAKLNNDLELINIWTKKWLVTINPDKTKSMIFSPKCQKPLHPQLKYDNKAIESVSNQVSRSHTFV
jgi:hypothetical protein